MATHEVVKSYGSSGLHLEKVLCSQPCELEELSDEEFVTWSSDEDSKDETCYPNEHVEETCRRENSITRGGKKNFQQGCDEKQKHAALVKTPADKLAVEEEIDSHHVNSAVSTESPIIARKTKENSNLKLIRKTRRGKGSIEVNTMEVTKRKEKFRRCSVRQNQGYQNDKVVDNATKKKNLRLVGKARNGKGDMEVNKLEYRQRKDDTRYPRRQRKKDQIGMEQDSTREKEKSKLLGKRSGRALREMNTREDRGKKDKDERYRKRQKQEDKSDMVVDSTTEKEKLRLKGKTRNDKRGIAVKSSDDRRRIVHDRRYPRRQKQEDQSGIEVENTTEEKSRLVEKRKSDRGGIEMNTPDDREQRENDRRYPRRQWQEDPSSMVENNSTENGKLRLVRKTRSDQGGMDVGTPEDRERKENDMRYPRRQKQEYQSCMVVENTTEEEKPRLVGKTRSDRGGMEVDATVDRERKEKVTRYPRRHHQRDPLEAGFSGNDRVSLSDEKQKHSALLKEDLSSPLGNPMTSAHTPVVLDDAEEKDHSRLIGKTRSGTESIEVNEPDNSERKQRCRKYPLRHRQKDLSEACISGGDKTSSNSRSNECSALCFSEDNIHMHKNNCKSTRDRSGSPHEEDLSNEEMDDEEASWASDVHGNGSIQENSSTKRKGTHACEKKRHICKKCGKRFAMKIYLTKHRKIHTEEKPHVCDVCGMEFSLLSYLRKHKHTHSGKKPYHCDICGSSFTRVDSLTRHRRAHTRTIPYDCEKHEKTCTVTKEKRFICDKCGLRFSQKSVLAIHERTHTGEKPYKCDTCEMRFARKQSVKEHQRIHTGERPFVCSICGKGYARAIYSFCHGSHGIWSFCHGSHG